MENRALGKGLLALIPDKIISDAKESVTYLKTIQIKENSLQPRMNFDSEKLSDLIASVKKQGVLQPILVRKKNDGYEVIAGERRLRAAQALALDEVPVVIKSVTDQEALVLGLIENIQREELNAIEKAQAFQRLIDEFSFTQDSIAQSVGKDRTTVTNLLRLLKLPKEIQRCISSGTLSVGHGRALASIENPQLQKKTFDRTIKKEFSVRQLEHLVRQELSRAGHHKRPSTSRQKDVYLAAMEEELQRALGTRVRIEQRQKRGRIIIEYYSPDDLERITKVIKE